MHTVNWLQTHGVIFTLGVFSLVVIVTYLPGLRAVHERHAAIPLDPDDVVGAGRHTAPHRSLHDLH